MRRALAVLLTVALAAAAAVLAVAILAAQVSAPDDAPADVGWGPIGEPGEGLAAARATGGWGDYAAALAQADASPSDPTTTARPWEARGPFQVGGRLTDLALAPDGTVLAAAASGGLWASRDGGRTLDPLWPDDATPAIGAVAVTADGVIVVGTGEANAGGGSLTHGGTGVVRSTDGGGTWSAPTLPTSGTVADIEPHPTDPAVLWLAAGGDLFRGGGERGVFRSDDAGRTWDLVLPPDTPTTGGADIAVDPADPDHLLAATWDRQRTPDRRRYGGRGSGVHVSTDGGRTWDRVAGGLPGFAEDSGRTAVAFSPADPDRVYAVVTRADGRADGLWRSDDGGVTWGRVDADPQYEPRQFIFAWWFGRVFPSPEDPDRVLVPGLSLLESVDGGVTFTADDRVHPDQHDLVWDPRDPSRAWLATDGGMYASTGGGRTLTWTPTRDQPFTQAYDVAVSPQAPDALAAGFQDVGCMVRPDVPLDPAADGWTRRASCGDGTQVLAHPGDATRTIVCGQYGRCHELRADGRTPRTLHLPDDGRSAWARPLIRLPDQPAVLVTGGTRVHRSDDAGETWIAVSDDLTRGRSPDPDYPFGTITALAAGPGGTWLAAGTDDGQVWRSTDAGRTWTAVVDGDRWVTSLVLLDDGALLVGTSGYRSGEGSPQVLHVAPAPGTAVRPVGQGLPAAPVNDLLLVDRGLLGRQTLVAATDVGVYLAPDATADQLRWRRLGTGLPQAPVTALDHLAGTRALTVGTYGRGVWRTALSGVTRIAGADRYGTASAVVRSDTATPGASADADTVLLASGEAFPDALAAAAVAAADPTARLLLTRPHDLPAASAELLAQLDPDDVVVVGGTAVVGPTVVDAVRSLVPDAAITRVAGSGRYGTAAALAGGRRGGAVVLATAGSPWDALAGAPLAAARQAPILLVDHDRLPPETADALDAIAPDRIIVLGGESAVGPAVVDAVRARTGAQATRLAGPSRTATAAAVTGALGPGDRLWLAAGDRFPDALAAAATGDAVLLAGGPAEALAEAVRARAPRHIHLVGGPAAVPDAVAVGLLG